MNASTVPLRWVLPAMGLAAGVAFWIIFVEGAVSNLAPLVEHAIVLATALFFAAFAGMAGPLPPASATVRAAGLTAGAVALSLWSHARFLLPDAEMVATPGLVMPLLVSFALAVPPVIAGRQCLNHAVLFDTAWSGVVRLTVAVVFVLFFWLLYAFCNLLLQIVGIGLLDAVFESGPGISVLTGLAFGIALSIAGEYPGLVRTMLTLVLNLMRVLIVPVAVCLLVFTVALIFAGPGNVTGGFSTAVTLLMVGALTLVLIAATLGPDEARASSARLVLLAARVSVLILPVLAALSVWAIAVRVGDVGWSPSRILAMILAGLLSAYALLYVLAQAVPSRTFQIMRAGGIRIAFAAVVAGALVQTPLLDPFGISASSQAARLMTAENVRRSDLQLLEERWGKQGQMALVGLAEAERGTTDMRTVVVDAESGRAIVRDGPNDPERSSRRLARLEVWPTGSPPLRLESFAQTPNLARCAGTADGPFENCIAAYVDIRTDVPGDEMVIVMSSQADASDSWLNFYFRGPNDLWTGFGTRYVQQTSLVSDVRSGKLTTLPAQIRDIRIGTTTVRVQNN
ncbi:MAG: hypothetical protein AAFV09_00500 [Pseudomonadota bacterium]